MDPLIAKLERRFSPEFSRLLAKRIRNTPGELAAKALFRIHTDKHPLNDCSTNEFTQTGSEEHARQVLDEIFSQILKPKP